VKTSELFRRLLGYSLVYWRGFLIAVLAMIITAATETAFPALMKPLLDNGFEDGAQFPIWWVPAAVIGIFVTRGISTFISSYSMNWISHNVLRDIRFLLYQKLLHLPAHSIDQKAAGTLISKVITDAQMVLEACTTVLTSLVRDSLVLIGLLAWLLWLNWQLTLVVFAMLPILAFLTLEFSKRLRSVSRQYLDAISDLTVSVEETVVGNRVIKIFDGIEHEKERFGGINRHFRAQAMRIAVASALQTPISQLIAAIGVATVLSIALIQSRAGQTSVGDFVSFLTAMLMMFSPIKNLSNINPQIQRGLAAAEGVFGLLDEAEESGDGRTLKHPLQGHIVFDQVSLQYPSRNSKAIDRLSFTIEPKETVAFVGRSGSGKTSIINLLPRIYEPTDGRILIDGIEIGSVERKSLRTQFAMVSQEVLLFNDTIKQNVLYGRRDATDHEVSMALEAANLASFVASLPKGLETVVGDRGIRLSGGQRQRIAIARAILKNAPILILDEATSALDTESESAIRDAIERLRVGRTTLIVAHRLSTIEHADKVFVMDAGRLVQSGTHKSLLQSDGLYKELYRETR
jgi:subfamily B ATP-binding cassette protein MsbA